MTVSKNPDEIKKMFNKIASKYDFNNNIISLGLHKLTKKLVLKNLTIPNNSRILDECTGTGDIPYYLNKMNSHTQIIGIDFSEKMIEKAREKHPNLTFLEGDCTNLPFQNNSFDIITMCFGLRNIEDYSKAIKESFRVLEDSGELLYLDFGEKSIFSDIFDFIACIATKILYGKNSPYEYLVKSKREFFTPKNLIQEFEKEGFILKMRKDYLFGIISMQIYEKTKTAYC